MPVRQNCEASELPLAEKTPSSQATESFGVSELTVTWTRAEEPRGLAWAWVSSIPAQGEGLGRQTTRVSRAEVHCRAR